MGVRESTQKEELDKGVEFLRRRDFLKPSGARVVGQSWIEQLFAVRANYLDVSSSAAPSPLALKQHDGRIKHYRRYEENAVGFSDHNRSRIGLNAAESP